ncbi:hypothetical protein BDY21DRAFT_388543 [Lineolata rhizophorae]|uniref:Fungal-type protein kinase domain-containing protein n=1 Tax=Lineolata rhizophorae TaxID=578093 RepID=A0A6A6NLD7_9PEZI|nr:hypothetical protein BDY21DRAFT_388543 [Lineolata rhizophorae]
MAAPTTSEVVKANPIGKGLDAFRKLKNLGLDLVLALQSLPACRSLPSSTGRGTLTSDLSRFIPVIDSNEFDAERIRPLLKAIIDNEPDETILNKVAAAFTESTPPPDRCLSYVNSSEHRKYMDDALKEELTSVYVGVPGLYEAFFGEVDGLASTAEAVFKNCKEEDSPLYSEQHGWRGWPESAKEKDVLTWFANLVGRLADLSSEPSKSPQRRPIAQPNRPLEGSTADRKLDVGFVDDPKARAVSKYHWSHILVPGELKSNPATDTAPGHGRRFVLGFTLCGPLMWLWSFDRAGAVASSSFDINREGQQLVSVVLGYLWMNDEQLGFDPTISTSNGERYIDIKRDGKKERLVIDEVMKRAACVAGRATTCWKAHRKGDELRNPLVIKDSWQYAEREEEGLLLQEATEKGVTNVARYYHHETVRVGARRTGRIGKKRSSSYADTELPPNKRACSSSSTKAAPRTIIPNRVHRRVIVRDYGMPLPGKFASYEDLHKKAHMWHCDISQGNLMMNEDDGNPSWSAFLIDLDLAVRVEREEPSGALGKTGTRAFMAIGVLLGGEKRTFMHDLESFFWVLFWICIHYNGPNEMGRVVPKFDKWNFVSTEELAENKKGIVTDETNLLKASEEYFMPYYQPLVPWLNRLRRVVFPGGARRKAPDQTLYTTMKEILREAQEDAEVKNP